jgi:hypothetical protein
MLTAVVAFLNKALGVGSDKDASQIKATLAGVAGDDWLALKRRRRRGGGIALDKRPSKDWKGWAELDSVRLPGRTPCRRAALAQRELG